MNVRALDACPECGVNWKYGKYSHIIGIEIPAVYDGVLFWRCPKCGQMWGRFSEKKVRWTKYFIKKEEEAWRNSS